MYIREEKKNRPINGPQRHRHKKQWTNWPANLLRFNPRFQVIKHLSLPTSWPIDSPFCVVYVVPHATTQEQWRTPPPCASASHKSSPSPYANGAPLPPLSKSPLPQWREQNRASHRAWSGGQSCTGANEGGGRQRESHATRWLVPHILPFISSLLSICLCSLSCSLFCLCYPDMWGRGRIPYTGYVSDIDMWWIHIKEVSGQK